MEHHEVSARPIDSFVYKVAARCNLNCTYCYEYNMGDDSWKLQPHFTSLHAVEKAAIRVREHALEHSLEFVTFSFHGGEPLLAGHEFFVRATNIIRDRLSPEVKCSFGVQTNGTLLNGKIVEAFDANEISIGLSLDGPRAVNDSNRVFANGKGSFDSVMRGVQSLQTDAGNRIFAGILSVINVEAEPLEVFDFLASLSPPSIDLLLPHGNWDNVPVAKRGDSSATPYADWLITIFDEWWGGRHDSVGIRTFEEIIEYKLGGPGKLETLGLSPVTFLCIAADGAIEAVDTLKSVYPGAHQLGFNIYDHSFDQVLNHPMVRARQLGVESLGDTCKMCEIVETCGGGYFPHRWSKVNGFRNPSVYCLDLMKLIGHIHSRVEDYLERHGSIVPTIN